MDILLDVNIAVDICTRREPHFETADMAVSKCLSEGARLWLYVGSVQTLEYVTRDELRRANAKEGFAATARQLERQTRQVLKEFCSDKHWLAALADEGNVFDSPDPEDEQFIRALARFAPGTVKLLTRDETLCDRYPEHAIAPQAYLALPLKAKPIAFIDLAAQQDPLRPQVERYVHRVLHHGQYIMGPEVRELEEKLAAHTGARHCITVSSGTEALLISLMAHGIGPGHEVITTPFTFAATAEMIVLAGAKPVFVDIQPGSCNIDPALIEAEITPATRAIMPVCLYGQVADMDEINAIAAKHGLTVIEDAAQSFGASYKGRKSCNVSHIGCTSFFPSKPLGCYGDGGAIFTSDDALAQACREIRVHGQSARYLHTRLGVGGRMDTLQCAIVLAKLDRFDWEVEQRKRLGARYRELIVASGAAVELLTVADDRDCVWAQYTIKLDAREAVQAALKAAGIPTAVHYPKPLHHQPAYAQKDFPADSCPESNRAAQRVMSLPMSADMTDAQQVQVVQALVEALSKT